MAALLVALSVAAVLMTAVMPVWKQMARREKEAELIFRGEQYARAIGLFQKRAGPGVLPPSVEALVEGRYLRKKFKDPITNDEFDMLSPVQAAGGAGGPSVPGSPGAGTPGSAGTTAGRGAGQPSGAGSVVGAAPTTGRGAVGGIIGVASKSKGESLRNYKGRTHYNEWQFVYIAQTQQAGQTAPGGDAGAPGGPGGIGGVGGGRGRGNTGDGRGNPFGSGGRQGPGGRFGQGQSPFGQQPPATGPQGPAGQRGGSAPAQPTAPSGGSIFAPRR